MYTPVLSQMHLASRSKALQHRVKQFAHSPHRPLLVSSSFSGLLYLVLTTQGRQTSGMYRNSSNSLYFVCSGLNSQKAVLKSLTALVGTNQNVSCQMSFCRHKPWESRRDLAALAVVVLHPLSSPAEVITAGAERAAVLCRPSTAAAWQTVHPGEEVLFEPPEQLQHQEVFYSKFTVYKQESKHKGTLNTLQKQNNADIPYM